MTEASCIYAGYVTHHRLRPRVHSLRYRVFWMLFDLGDIDSLSQRLSFFSRNRFNLISFFDRDFGEGDAIPLRTQAETMLRKAGCRVDEGATIKLLCIPRVMGYAFNPLSVYFCYRGDGSLEATIYEVHNTFGERYSYVIPADGARGKVEQSCRKEFHVSPFLGMEMSYTFHVSLPKEYVSIAIQGKECDEPVIAASLTGKRRELSDMALLKAFITHPLLTLKVITAIHWHGLRLMLKGFPIYGHQRAAHPEWPKPLTHWGKKRQQKLHVWTAANICKTLINRLRANRSPAKRLR